MGEKQAVSSITCADLDQQSCPAQCKPMCEQRGMLESLSYYRMKSQNTLEPGSSLRKRKVPAFYISFLHSEKAQTCFIKKPMSDPAVTVPYKGTQHVGPSTRVSVGRLYFHPFYCLSVKWKADKYVKNEH